MEYIPDAPLEPKEPAESNEAIGAMVDEFERLNREIEALWAEKSMFESCAREARHLDGNLKSAVLNCYSDKIESDRMVAEGIKARLAYLGYVA